MSRIFKSFEARELKKRPFVIKIADYLTSLFGSVWFLVLNFLFFAGWLLFADFDPFPYSLLTMILSIEAIFLTIIVLISQHKQSHIETIRQELDMQVNLLSEREITKILKLLKALSAKLEHKIDDPELDEMLKSTDISYIERSLEKQLKKAESS